MKKKILNFKNKLLISFILFIIFIYCLTGFCSAVDYNYTTIEVNGFFYDDVYTVNIPLSYYNCSYYVIFDWYDSSGTSVLACYMSSEPLTFRLLSNGDYRPVSFSHNIYYSASSRPNNDGIYVFSPPFTCVEPSDIATPFPNFIGSNYDVYTEDGDLVFQGAPVTVEPMEMKQVEEILPEMWKIVQMIIPACLLIFGTLLVVYLIKSKNLLQL